MADGFTSAVGLGLQVHVPCGRRRVADRHLYPDDLSALLVQLCCVLLVCLLLAVLETLALVVLQQAVPAAEVAIAEATVTHDPLCRLLAVGGGTSELFGSHVDVSGCRSTDLLVVVVVVVR